MTPQENLLQALKAGQEHTIRQALELNLTLTGEAPVDALTRLAMERDRQDWANDQNILQAWGEEWFRDWGTFRLLRQWVAACIKRMIPFLEDSEAIIFGEVVRMLVGAEYPGIMTHEDRRELKNVTAPLMRAGRGFSHEREAALALRLRGFASDAPKYLVRLHPDSETEREWQVRDLMRRLLAFE